MKRLIEMSVFSGLAVLLHLAFFARSFEAGEDTAGAGGAAALSLEAADATVAQMVAAWERPVAAPVLEAPEVQTPPPETSFPSLDLATAPDGALPRPRPQLPMPTPRETERPTIDTAPAAPLSKMAPRSSMRAPPRPEAPKPQVKKPTPKAEPARRAEKTTEARAAQRASGAGGGATSGRSQQSANPSVSAGQRADAQARWGGQIRAKIERAKRYPRGLRASGQARLAITVSRSGQLLGVRVQGSSGNATLDRAAVDAVRRAGRFPRAPQALRDASYTFVLAILLKK